MEIGSDYSKVEKYKIDIQSQLLSYIPTINKPKDLIDTSSREIHRWQIRIQNANENTNKTPIRMAKHHQMLVRGRSNTNYHPQKKLKA